jgi:hypothetical protein
MTSAASSGFTQDDQSASGMASRFTAVSITDGAMALTPMPRGRSSLARDRVNAATAALAMV